MLSLTILAVDCLGAEEITSDLGAGNTFRWILVASKGKFCDIIFSYMQRSKKIKELKTVMKMNMPEYLKTEKTLWVYCICVNLRLTALVLSLNNAR